MQWAEDLTRSEDAARWICGIFLDFPCLSLLYNNCFCNFSINSIAVLILLGCVDFAWLCSEQFLLVKCQRSQNSPTVTFWVLAPRPKPVGMAPEIGRGILPLHLSLPVGVINLTKRAIFFKIWLCLL